MAQQVDLSSNRHQERQQSLPSGKRSRASTVDSVDLFKYPAFLPNETDAPPASRSGNFREQSGYSMAAPEHGPESLRLSEAELMDMGIVSNCAVDSKRFRDAINDFVDRGLSLGGTDNRAGCAALQYFMRLRREFSERGFEPAKLKDVHDAMIHQWQGHMILRIGSTVNSFSLLSEVIEALVTQAESIGGLPSDPELRLNLSNAISGVLHPDLQTSSGPVMTMMAINNEGNRLRDFSVPSPESVVGATEHPVTTSTGFPSTHAPPILEAQATTSDRTPAERFPDARAFFRYHAMKAKANARKETWHQDEVRDTAGGEANAEWTTFDVRTQSIWADMRERFIAGDQRMLWPQNAAHLFDENGYARVSWISNNFVADRHTGDFVDSAVEVEPIPVRLAPYDAITSKYENVQAPERTVFFQLVTKKSISHAQVKRAFRSTASSAQISGGAESEQVDWRRSNICTVRFKQTKTARALASKTMKIDGQEVRLCLYPSTAPHMFISHMNHVGNTGFRLDAVYLSITSVVPGSPFHLRKEPSGDNTSTTWLIVYKDPPNLLRFKVGIMRKDGKFRAVQFEPVIPETACTVCNGGHSPLDCDILKAAKRKELGVKKRESNYIAKKPSAV